MLELATDPGAWNIIGWIAILFVIGAAVLWAVTTLFLATSQPDAGAKDGEASGSSG